MIQLCFLQHQHFHVEVSLFHLFFVQHNEATTNRFTCVFFQLVIQTQELLIPIHFHGESRSDFFDFLHEL